MMIYAKAEYAVAMSPDAGRITARRTPAVCLAMFLSAIPAVTRAQDVPGIEICTTESRMDRRTGCLQSNVNFLQQEISRNARDTEQKLSAASREIGALKERLEAANRETAALRAAFAAMEARIAHVEKATPQPKPDAKPQVK